MSARLLTIRPTFHGVALELGRASRELRAMRLQLAEACRLLGELLDADANGIDHGLRRRAERELTRNLRYLRETR